MDSAELANQRGWLIGGWSQAVYNEGVFPFFVGGGVESQAVSQINVAINDEPLLTI